MEKRTRARWAAFGFLALLLLAGCGPREDELTTTERQRMRADPRGLRFLAEADRAHQEGRYLMALALSDSAEKYAPELADVHFFRGRVYTDLNQFEIARAAYQVTLENDPTYRGAHMNLGINHVRQGRLREAIREFQLEEAVAPSSNLYLELGRAYARLGEADSALTAYYESIRLDSTNASTFMWMGQLYEEMGDFETALAYSRRGSELRPDNLEYRYIIGSQLFRMGMVDEALEHLEPVARERPYHHGAQYNMGQVLMRLGREDEAQSYLEQAELAQEFTQAVNEAQDAVSRDPDDWEAWLILSEVYRLAEMYDRAADALRRAIVITPWNTTLEMNLGTLLLQAGDTDGAIRQYRAILQDDSTIADVWLNLGAAYGNAGRFDDAQQAWEKTLELRPDHPTARQYLAMLDDLR